MAGDHEQRVVFGASGDEAGRPLDDTAARDAALSDDADSLDALRSAWLASDDGSGAEAILAATVPLSPAQQEQIVQRLLREGERARPRRARAAGAPRVSAPALRRVPLWSAAAACALCCWMAAHAPSAVGPRGTESAARRDSASSLSGTGARVSPALREAHDMAAAPSRAVPLPAGEDLTELAETYAQQQRFDEAEALFQIALTERERRLGPAHKDVADTLTRLATLYQTQHLYTKAEPLYVRALEIDPPFAVF